MDQVRPTRVESELVVEITAVSMAYQRGALKKDIFLALDNVDLHIMKGETVGFIGNNGAGKSTTMRIVLGLQTPTSGVARLNGKSVDDPVSRLGVAYVPENPYLYDYLTPLELLSMGIHMHHRTQRHDAKKLRETCYRWLEKFRIDHVANKRIRTFSKGMTQRTALAHALACEPDFLILDEPLSGLDPIGRQEVVDILCEYRASGKSLFFSSHVLNDVERLADRFIFIHGGRIQAICSTTSFLSERECRYSVVVEGTEAPEGFESISSRLWQREVHERELCPLMSQIVASQHTARFSLYSVRSMNTLDRAYEKFVQSAK